MKSLTSNLIKITEVQDCSLHLYLTDLYRFLCKRLVSVTDILTQSYEQVVFDMWEGTGTVEEDAELVDRIS